MEKLNVSPTQVFVSVESPARFTTASVSQVPETERVPSEEVKGEVAGLVITIAIGAVVSRVQTKLMLVDVVPAGSV